MPQFINQSFHLPVVTNCSTFAAVSKSGEELLFTEEILPRSFSK